MSTKNTKPVLPAKAISNINAPFDSKRFSADIIAKRIKENLTQVVAAKAAGVAPTTIFAAESRGTVNIAILPKICNWLGSTVQHYYTPKKK